MVDSFRYRKASVSAPRKCGGAAQSLTLWLFILLGILLLVGALSATSLRDLIRSNPASASVQAESTEAEPASLAPADPDANSAASEFGIDQLLAVFSVLGESERKRVLEDEAAFRNLVRNERARWSVLQAARTAGLESSPQVSYLMQRSAEQVLVDTFIKLNVGAAVPADFPSEAQVRQFYSQNQARYRVEARIPVWQIFLAISEQADTAQVADIERLADQLATALRAGKLDFAKAASEYSAHEASKLNGGFMGNLKVDELIPEVKSAVSEAKSGTILEPVRSASGIHILRRGESIEATQLSLEQASKQVRALLRQTAETKARELIVARAREKAGGDPGATQLSEWRTTLSAAMTKTP